MAGLRDRRRLSRSQQSTRGQRLSQPVLLNGSRLLWVLVVIWGEFGSVFFSLRDCRWPDKDLKSNDDEKPTHVLLLSDPQVRHPTISFAKSVGGSGLSTLVRGFIYDRSLKKSWSVAMRLRPHTVVFLGDMLASGRNIMSEMEYLQYFRRFQRLFPLPSSTKAYFLPGNNDVGLGMSAQFSKGARRRFAKHFGFLNQDVAVRNHTLVLLDAPGLVEEDYQRAAKGLSYEQWTPIHKGPVEFVKSLTADARTQPNILFTHIPLFRPDTKSCGPLREKKTGIRRGVGHGFQNTLGKQTTEFLLNSLRPVAVFSGDDRDYCEYSHPMHPADPESPKGRLEYIREVTVKSFSAAKTIRRPGFQLLSLVTPSPSTTAPSHSFSDKPCLLPDPFGIYTSLYLPCIIVTLLALALLNYLRPPHARKPFLSLPAHNMYTRSPDPAPLSISPHSASTHHTYNPSHPGTPTPASSRSALFSPFSPFSPTSPARAGAGAFPGTTVRTSLAAPTPTLRASSASRPATPRTGAAGSPMLSPVPSVFAHHAHDDGDADEEDALYPSQYAADYVSLNSPGFNANGNGKENGNGWGPGAEPPSTFFLPAPGSKPLSSRPWEWSWSFVFRGRRRRMALRVPTFLLSLPRARGGVRGPGGGAGGTGLAGAVLADFARVAGPAGALWLIVVIWML